MYSKKRSASAKRNSGFEVLQSHKATVMGTLIARPGDVNDFSPIPSAAGMWF